MASDSFVDAEHLQQWTEELSRLAKTYSPSGSIESRMKMISLAENVVQGLTDPSFVGHIYVSRVSSMNVSMP